VQKSRAFEKLVAKIVEELEPEAVVTWDDHIVGKESGLQRQIDVSVRRPGDSWAPIDAKDYSRPSDRRSH